MTIPACLLLLACMVLLAAPAGAQEPDAPVPAADLISGEPHPMPIAGLVTMVDIGAHSCIPCKMMTPIIEELSKEYDGRAAIAFIDVWKHRDEASRYGITAIPTQIFYDAQGKERYRHVGYLDKASIVAKLTELGVE
nr:thioredoxin family protein [Pseudodesulfovibrio mercurii]